MPPVRLLGPAYRGWENLRLSSADENFDGHLCPSYFRRVTSIEKSALHNLAPVVELAAVAKDMSAVAGWVVADTLHSHLDKRDMDVGSQVQLVASLAHNAAREGAVGHCWSKVVAAYRRQSFVVNVRILEVAEDTACSGVASGGDTGHEVSGGNMENTGLAVVYAWDLVGILVDHSRTEVWRIVLVDEVHGRIQVSPLGLV